MSVTPAPPHYDQELEHGMPIIVDLGKKPPRFRFLATIFFLQGVSLLFAFNAMINSIVFFYDRSKGAWNGEYIMDIYLIGFALVCFLAMIVVPIKMRGGSPYRQIWMAQAGNVIVFIIFALLNLKADMSPGLFMGVSIAVVIALSICSVIAFFGIFTIIAHVPGYSERLSIVVAYGQGAAGTIVCLFKLISLVFHKEDAGEGASYSAYMDSLVFFLFSAGFILVSTILFIPVRNIRRAESMLTLVPDEKLGAKTPSPLHQPPKAMGPLQEWVDYYMSVYRQIPIYFWSLFILFFQTMTLIPVFIYLNPAGEAQRVSKKFFEKHFYVIFNLLCYNIGDWLGRLLIGFHSLNIKNQVVLFILSLLRFGLMPFYLLTNLHIHGHLTLLKSPLSNEFAFAFVNLAFGLSAGYLVTCIMENAPEAVKDEKDRRFASFILMHCMTFALLIGSVFSLILEIILNNWAMPKH